ncbi:HEAT repeat domain-containing protein [Sediminitomix flava]|uniref:HEAT repeat protein n=1 Tax=Sediminitomix flava TaxID=379075 RepID=A0A315ZHR4_SEDFL|nr:HEAT repeat domain-containing protein [Sediminitomix flava]PWJ45071.1 HEAT repeat protein [Sediminitomix flava]
MEKEPLDDKLIRYLEGDLSKQEAEELETSLKQDDETKQDLEDFETLFKDLDSLNVTETPTSVDKVFYEALETEEQKAKGKTISFKAYWKIGGQVAAAIILFVFGMQFNSSTSDSPTGDWEQNFVQLSEEMKETKKLLILNMLKAPSASDRIQAVSYANELPEEVSEIVMALISSVRYDQNPNVRQNSAYALQRFGYDSRVQKALTEALDEEHDVSVQFALIEILSQWKVKTALPRMRELMQDKEGHPLLIDKAAEGVGLML